MPGKRRRPPAEKKALSYAKDRRNAYRANDKASRKAIPLRKAKAHRADRRKAAASLGRYETLGEEEAALTENALIADVERCKGWRKAPDQSLTDHIAQQDANRDFRGGRKSWVKRKRAEAKEHGASGVMWSWGGCEVASFFRAD